jgi:hypothetical protein
MRVFVCFVVMFIIGGSVEKVSGVVKVQVVDKGRVISGM